MRTTAVVLGEPERIGLEELDLLQAGAADIAVAVDWTAISTGTERLLYRGTMPAFPGLGYPLVPGYEAVGRVVEADRGGAFAVGQSVFVPGAQCFDGARGLFGASASRLVVPAARALPVSELLRESAVLLALAATAYHTFSAPGDAPPELIVGHGTLGRLLARVAIAMGAPPPTVWEIDERRMGCAEGYRVVHPDDDSRRDYRNITDVSGDPAILDRLVARLAPGGTIVLAGFYKDPLSFAFPPVFMREARLRVAAQWTREDLEIVGRLADGGTLFLDDLITHRADAAEATDAYRTAFDDPACLKLVMDWRAMQ